MGYGGGGGGGGWCVMVVVVVVIGGSGGGGHSSGGTRSGVVTGTRSSGGSERGLARNETAPSLAGLRLRADARADTRGARAAPGGAVGRAQTLAADELATSTVADVLGACGVEGRATSGGGAGLSSLETVSTCVDEMMRQDVREQPEQRERKQQRHRRK